MSSLDQFNLSEAQRAAVEDESPRVLVSAGAGSGKTTLLVAYFVHALIEDGVPPEDMVAVTFTRKAAAELSTRIRSQLRDCGREDLARAVESSSIGTIHSLCRRLIKERALEAGVDPAFSVLESDAAAMLKLGVLEEIWAETVESVEESHLGVLAAHRYLRDTVIALYDDLRNLGSPRAQIVVPSVSASEDPKKRVVEEIERALAAAAAVPKPGKSLQANVRLLEDALRHLTSHSPSFEVERLCADPAVIEGELRTAASFFPDSRSSSMEEVFVPVRHALREYRRFLAGLLAQPLVSVLNDLLARFDEVYTDRKREQALLDFADLELHARALVEAHRGERAPFFGPRARVLIDEFQDTNELQCAILENLGAERLLLVGDENQSIYRFRGADVEVFRRREQAHRSIPGSVGERVDSLFAYPGLHRLVENYRSGEQILAFVNRLFSADTFFGSRFAALKHARKKEPLATRPPRSVDVLVADCSGPTDPGCTKPDIGEVESWVVGLEVRRLLDEEGWQPRDIAILLPKLTHAEALQEGLEALGIASYLVRGKGYYWREEISDIRALLRVLLNPHDDLAMVTVLRSPLVGFSDDGLYLVGRARRARIPRPSLWEVLAEGGVAGLDASDVQAFEALARGLRSFQNRVGRPGIAALIDDLVTAYGYDVGVLASSRGDRRFANIRKLMRVADNYEVLQGPDLAGFVALLDGLGDVSTAEGSAPTLTEGENVVRIMTVHQAKGLQFPVVVLAGLGSEGPNTGTPAVALSQNGLTAVFFKGTKTRYEDFDVFWGPGDEIMAEKKAKDDEERRRVLYVAMTRAEDRLVLVGVKSRAGGRGGSPLHWILQGLGFDALPEPGGYLTVEGLEAVVRGVRVSELSVDFEQARQSAPAEGAGPQVASAAGPPPCPSFLEPPTSVVLPVHLSFSALAAFQACPRRFYLERILGLPMHGAAGQGTSPYFPSDDGAKVDPRVEGGDFLLDQEEVSTGRDVGLLVHGLLQRLALRKESPTRDELRAVAQDVMCAGPLTVGEEGLERALDLAQSFWGTPEASRAARAGAGTEVPFLFAHDGVTISGIMDLVWQEEDSWFIIDYKTNALAGKSPAEVARGYHLQACIYALAALHAGAAKVNMEFLFLEEPSAPVRLLYSERDRPAMELRLGSVLEKIRRGESSPAPGSSCGWCPVASLCDVLH